MTIFRHKVNQKLYVIEELILDIYHLNCNAFAGIYALPFDHDGERIIFRSKDAIGRIDYVRANFEEVAYV